MRDGSDAGPHASALPNRARQTQCLRIEALSSLMGLSVIFQSAVCGVGAAWGDGGGPLGALKDKRSAARCLT